MSTPERQQDPGEHGYGGTAQEFPAEDSSDGAEQRPDDNDARARESADPATRASGFDGEEEDEATKS